MTPQAAPPAANGVAPHTTRLPIDDAARALGISRATVRRRLRSGDLTGAQVATPHGRKWLVEVPEYGTLRSQGVAGCDTLGTQGRSPAESVTPQAEPTGSGGSAPPGGAATPGEPTGSAAREVALLQAHVADLRRQLEDRTREVGQLHTLLAQAHQRLLMGRQVSDLGESGGEFSPPGRVTAAAETFRIQQNGAAPVAWERRRWWHRLLWG